MKNVWKEEGKLQNGRNKNEKTLILWFTKKITGNGFRAKVATTALEAKEAFGLF